MLKLGTVFSGIGAIEHALERLSIPHEIAFACDNGNIEIDLERDEIEKNLSDLSGFKEKKAYVDGLYTALLQITTNGKLKTVLAKGAAYESFPWSAF
ncbi:hypothetical protein M1L59_15490 [Acinetobacter schindleri]|uniref:hypothetical protein n=1 Tax=Acinetobacter schindleri TaxID=108981 RepID=UPI00200A3F27|nr:hypothetical protein [Acinetobacter schindleri]MCK8642071.1 hypothetical protein [Acinetobacter schindleri]